MRPRQFRTGPILAVLLFLLVLWPAMQLYGMLKPSHTSSDPLAMLYEVAQFQISLWQGTMQEAKRYESTAPLNKVKLVAYSANYTHDRLVRAVGGDRLAPLPGLSRFVEFITVLQISGDRQLTDLERRFSSRPRPSRLSCRIATPACSIRQARLSVRRTRPFKRPISASPRRWSVTSSLNSNQSFCVTSLARNDSIRFAREVQTNFDMHFIISSNYAPTGMFNYVIMIIN